MRFATSLTRSGKHARRVVLTGLVSRTTKDADAGSQLLTWHAMALRSTLDCCNVQRYPSASTVTAVALLTSWCELEDGVAVRLGGEVLRRESLVAWKYGRVARAMQMYCLRTGTASSAGTSRMV